MVFEPSVLAPLRNSVSPAARLERLSVGELFGWCPQSAERSERPEQETPGDGFARHLQQTLSGPVGELAVGGLKTSGGSQEAPAEAAPGGECQVAVAGGGG